jgi:hypothetical protein
MTAAGSRPSRTGRVAAPDCLMHMCHVRAADQRDLHLALPQTNDHSTVPGPVIASSLLPIAAKICRRSVSQCSSPGDTGPGAKLCREFARNSEQQKTLLGAPPTSQIEAGVSVHNGGIARLANVEVRSLTVTGLLWKRITGSLNTRSGGLHRRRGSLWRRLPSARNVRPAGRQGPGCGVTSLSMHASMRGTRASPVL